MTLATRWATLLATRSLRFALEMEAATTLAKAESPNSIRFARLNATAASPASQAADNFSCGRAKASAIALATRLADAASPPLARRARRDATALATIFGFNEVRMLKSPLSVSDSMGFGLCRTRH
jgi:hypothetical protein